MLRYKTETRPGLVVLYDIQPGNGAGQFLQPRSPHGADVIPETDHRLIMLQQMDNRFQKKNHNLKDKQDSVY